MNEQNRLDLLKFIHQTVNDELNRSRDWPFKAFVSVFAFFSIIGLYYRDSSPRLLEQWVVTGISILLVVFTAIVIIKQHYRYQEYRQIQRNLQHGMGLHKLLSKGSSLIPSDWTQQACVDSKALKGTHSMNYGVWYYLVFLISVATIALFSVWCYSGS